MSAIHLTAPQLAQLQKYRQRQAVIPAAFAALPPARPRVIVVMPCYDEAPENSLASLEECPEGEHVLLLMVFNQPAGDPLAQKHREQAARWHGHSLHNGILIWAPETVALPPKQAGVGLARKIGMDAALHWFERLGFNGLIANLDADCRVSANYLQTLHRTLDDEFGAYSLYFEHPLEEVSPPAARQHILLYESWLRYYVQALRWAGYPNAYHCVGSSMAVKAVDYARVGGMNRRKAGEDFYFLHKIISHGRLQDLTDCCVYPSARQSKRVPFGTGRAMVEMAQGHKDFSQVYHPAIFRTVREGWAVLRAGEAQEQWPEPWRQAFRELNWTESYRQLRQRSVRPGSYVQNLHHWLDGFKMRKLVHYFRDAQFGECPLEAALRDIWPEVPREVEAALTFLRQLDRRSYE